MSSKMTKKRKSNILAREKSPRRLRSLKQETFLDLYVAEERTCFMWLWRSAYGECFVYRTHPASCLSGTRSFLAPPVGHSPRYLGSRFYGTSIYYCLFLRFSPANIAMEPRVGSTPLLAERFDNSTDESTADKNQLARMVALLGPVPEELLGDSGPRAFEFFSEDGSARGGPQWDAWVGPRLRQCQLMSLKFSSLSSDGLWHGQRKSEYLPLNCSPILGLQMSSMTYQNSSWSHLFIISVSPSRVFWLKVLHWLSPPCLNHDPLLRIGLLASIVTADASDFL